MKALAEENKKISDALKVAGYETVKIDILQIRNAETGTIDLQIWARSEEKS
jgi:outer membrane protein assembly factor BamA